MKLNYQSNETFGIPSQLCIRLSHTHLYPIFKHFFHGHILDLLFTYLEFLDDIVAKKHVRVFGMIFKFVVTSNLFVTSKNEFSNSPIHEFKVLQNVFKIKKQGLKCFLNL